MYNDRNYGKRDGSWKYHASIIGKVHGLKSLNFDHVILVQSLKATYLMHYSWKFQTDKEWYKEKQFKSLYKCNVITASINWNAFSKNGALIEEYFYWKLLKWKCKLRIRLTGKNARNENTRIKSCRPNSKSPYC